MPVVGPAPALAGGALAWQGRQRIKLAASAPRRTGAYLFPDLLDDDGAEIEELLSSRDSRAPLQAWLDGEDERAAQRR